jgi:hypothetical protein
VCFGRLRSIGLGLGYRRLSKACRVRSRNGLHRSKPMGHMQTRLAFGLSVALALWPGTALATLDGNQLFTLYQSSTADRVACALYVQGVVDALRSIPLPLVCARDDLTTRQLTDTVVQYLRDHPEQRHYSAASLVTGVAVKLFPCKEVPKR